MKNKHGIWQMIIGTAVIACGILFLFFRESKEVVPMNFFLILVGVICTCRGGYLSSRTEAQYKKKYGDEDERSEMLKGKAGFFSFMLMQVAYIAALTVLAVFDRKNLTALYITLGLFIVNGLSYVISCAVYSKKM